jgi:hypothetical protein
MAAVIAQLLLETTGDSESQLTVVGRIPLTVRRTTFNGIGIPTPASVDTIFASRVRFGILAAS